MFIIGHRGAAGLAPENTLASFKKAYELDVDMIEFDVRLTKDNIPVLMHDSRLGRTHHSRQSINNLTHIEIKKLFKDLPIPTLEQVLDKYFGKVLLDIELKRRGSAEVVYELLSRKYIKKPADWDLVLISSFSVRDLLKIRKLNKKVNLALLHHENPFIFMAFHRSLNLTAVGFHRLYVNHIALKFAKKAGIFTYAYTVNRLAAAQMLVDQGIDGIITNYPNLLSENASKKSE